MLTPSLSAILIVSILSASSLDASASEFQVSVDERVAQLSYEEQILREEGILQEGDSVLPDDGSLYDFYSFEGYEGQAISIVLTSEDFDTYLILLTPNNEVIKQDDFTTNDLDSALLFVLPTNGTYTILVNSYDETGRGRYVLSVTTLPREEAPLPSTMP